MAISIHFLVATYCLLLLQGQLALANPASRVKRQRSNEQPLTDNLSDLISSLITTGLRAAEAFISTGPEVGGKLISAVGGASLGPLLNVSRSLTAVRKNIDGGRPVSTSNDLRSLTNIQRVNENIEPALKSFNKALDGATRNGGLFRQNDGSGLLGLLVGNSQPSSKPLAPTTRKPLTGNLDVDYDIPEDPFA